MVKGLGHVPTCDHSPRNGPERHHGGVVQEAPRGVAHLPRRACGAPQVHQRGGAPPREGVRVRVRGAGGGVRHPQPAGPARLHREARGEVQGGQEPGPGEAVRGLAVHAQHPAADADLPHAQPRGHRAAGGAARRGGGGGARPPHDRDGRHPRLHQPEGRHGELPGGAGAVQQRVHYGAAGRRGAEHGASRQEGGHGGRAGFDEQCVHRKDDAEREARTWVHRP
mmetsp:Transcript_14250/g.30527  ORF Transcript_14250/g.30527 Transcript_14250/m.30527 type:complete len:224 (-) Transcript_14250:211-882(-)